MGGLSFPSWLPSEAVTDYCINLTVPIDSVSDFEEVHKSARGWGFRPDPILESSLAGFDMFLLTMAHTKILGR